MLIDDGQYRPLNKRKIREETCRKFNYLCGHHKGNPVQVACYYKNGEVIAQKIRTPDKRFYWLGDQSNVELFGQHLWRNGGKRIVVTEGEIDALSVAQCFNLKWPVVSVPNGAQSATKYLKQQIEFLESFDEIVLAFDNDEPGRKAMEECALLFTPGKVKIANWSPFKDANEMLQAGKSQDVAGVIFEAKEYRPDGIVTGAELSLEELMTNEAFFCFDIPYPKLNDKIRGLRKGELTTFCAGSGVGKSTIVREIAYHLLTQHNLRIGYVALEESIKKTALGFIAIDNDVSLGDLFLNRELIEPDKFKASYEKTISNSRLFLYDHFGSLESDNLINKLKYLAVGCEVDFIVLDHISIVVSGIEGGEERRIIDNLMTNLRSLAENTGVGMLVVSHLKVPEGTPHEEGGRVTLNQLRGSGSIKQLSDNVIGLERNLQDEEESNISTVRVLKCRLFGEGTGVADQLYYNKETGRLKTYVPLEPEESEFDDEEEGTEENSASIVIEDESDLPF